MMRKDEPEVVGRRGEEELPIAVFQFCVSYFGIGGGYRELQVGGGLRQNEHGC